MDNDNQLFDKAVNEIERLLSTNTVVGEPIEIDGNTMIPLVSVGFGFGAGVGHGADDQKGSGTGGGGGVKPVAVIIVGPDGARIESVKSGAASAFEKVAETVGKAATASRAKEH